MSDAEKRMHCEKHGETAATFVCRHLKRGVACGYHASTEEPEDPWPDAWCDACEAAFEREGEWNDSNEPEITLLCTGCYETVRERNLRILAPLVPGQVAVDEEQFAEVAHATCERCKVRQEEAKLRWEFDTKERWYFDDEQRTMRFFDREDGLSVVADVVITGSFSTRSNTWMWAWGNEQYSDDQRADVDPVRVFGEVRGMPKLAEAQWAAEEVDGWEVTQIAADLLGAEAIYRMPNHHLMVFMLLRNFRAQPPPS